MSSFVVPKHVAIIMDGNGRWAQRQNKPRWKGHKAGTEAVENVIAAAAEAGVEVLSLFAFSSENWKRPPKEVQALMRLFLEGLQHKMQKLHRNNIRLRVLGDLSKFSKKIVALVEKAKTLTANNTGLTLVIALNYGGRWDITQAACRIAQEVSAGTLSIDQVDEAYFSRCLSFADLPDPDLLIRTSGEQRISNFFLWQLAYTELYFTDTLWPDFDAQAFSEALMAYARRKRRYGDVE